MTPGTVRVVAVVWTGPGPDVLLGVDRGAGESLRAQVQRQLRDAIRSGRLAQGERLPSSRVLADQLGVSRGVIVDTYSQLESEGYVAPRIGAGTHVVYQPPPATDAASSTGEPARSARLDVDFEHGIPDMASFPMRDWSWALGVAVRTLTLGELGDELGAGSARLREVVAGYLGRVRGSNVDAERVLICPGFRHGLNVALRALAGHGIERVALEDPGPLGHDAIARRCGLVPVPVPVDEDGIDVDALAASRVRAVVVTPAHQCPTGAVLTAARRLALADWAREVDGYILEDDYDAELRYDRRPVGSLQGLAPDRVLGMGSVSKTLVPMLRLGWIACPSALLPALVSEKLLLGRGAPALDQLALAVLIESGRFDRHLRHARGLYARRRETLVAALARHAPDVVVTGPSAGCHVVVRLPARCDEAEVVASCAARSVAVYGMSRYRSDGAADPPALVLGFGNLTESAIRRGSEVLGAALGTA